MTRLSSHVLVLVGALALATGACTSTTNNHNGQDDAGVHQLDGSSQQDGSQQNDGGGGACTKNGFTVAASTESADYDSSYNGFFYTGYTAETDPFDWLSVELYFDFGDPVPTMGPGTYTLGATADEQSYATCGTCVLVYGDCSMANQACGKTYFAQSGTLTITTMDNAGGFVASLTNARLVEVNIDSQSGATTPVANGGVWCISSYSMDLAITTPFPCTSNTDCESLTDTPYCLVDTGECVQCIAEANCSSLTATPHCDLDYNVCTECTEDAQCASNSNGTFCAAGMCGKCKSSFNCTTAATPVCQLNATSQRAECVAGVTCTGDDAGGANDTGPAGARGLTIAAAMNGTICDADADYDFYKFTTAAAGNITVTMTWAATDADLDFILFDSTGTKIDAGDSTNNPEVLALTAQAAGDYYIAVYAYEMSTTTTGPLPYTITVTTP